ncbi:zf-HC2 domain-containing protein [Anaerotignum sp. MB30-C6]|uniref:zf-HC2 domain-containing protein n=1 Tax=Anaerotignum sp. MB30-C6 TaxID=3070814 RepID=UPI0027DB32D2|nr:zf-HC2 domain-containing protein [Anaerotignum sp. MB30-C6]WMI80494.1 zf-HC2 domain-containing protein [Anaerotignum sp. MB30-C6]
MSLNCDIVMDLVALYHDGEASKTSEAAVRDHLKECKHCREYYRQYGVSDPATQNFNFSSNGNYSDLAKQMRVRRLWTFVAVLSYVSASLCALIMLLMRIRED